MLIQKHHLQYNAYDAGYIDKNLEEIVGLTNRCTIKKSNYAKWWY